VNGGNGGPVDPGREETGLQNAMKALIGAQGLTGCCVHIGGAR
jgi:hypothetical protein